MIFTVFVWKIFTENAQENYTVSNEENGFLLPGSLPRGPACGFSFVNRTQQRVVSEGQQLLNIVNTLSLTTHTRQLVFVTMRCLWSSCSFCRFLVFSSPYLSICDLGEQIYHDALLRVFTEH